MGPVVVMAVLSAASVSLTLPDGLKCPARASLSERLERVGLHVARTDVTFAVKIEPAPGAVHITARRMSDGKVFDRSVPTAGEECATIERLLVQLIHSWAQVRVPAVYPPNIPKESPLDGGAADVLEGR